MSSNKKLLMIEGAEEMRGESFYAIPGTHSWTCPTGVTSVSVVCVGGGGAGKGGGGGLGYKNDYSVTPGNSYTVVVGKGGTYTATTSPTQGSNYGQESYFVNNTTVKGGGGNPGSYYGTGGTYAGDGGGNGGNGGYGGGGAGGYSGNGGNSQKSGVSASAGSGGGGGGAQESNRSAGGGVGLFGQGSNGAVALTTSSAYIYASRGAQGGSGGEDAYRQVPSGTTSDQDQPPAPVFGAGGGTDATEGSHGGNGAVRIIWPGDTRTFPSTDVDTP
tara:strand:- start:2055 stop:2873 length:819 start_codon:yes stop_codon:yes gene_type:complete